MSLYDPKLVDKQVLGFCLSNSFFAEVKNMLDRTMFDREMKDIYDAICFSHTKYGKDITINELGILFDDRNPSLPDSTKKRVHEIISELDVGTADNFELHKDIIQNFWLRDKARQIGEKALEIFTGESEEFGELRKLIDHVEDGRISDKTTYTKVDKDFEEFFAGRRER